MKITEKKKVTEKIKEKTRKKKDEIKKETEEPEPEPKQLTAEEQIEEKLRLKKLQEDSDLELAKEAFGLNVSGLDAMNPSTRDEFTEFGRVLKEKIVQYEKSVHYAGFLETLLRDICISVSELCSNLSLQIDVFMLYGIGKDEYGSVVHFVKVVLKQSVVFDLSRDCNIETLFFSKTISVLTLQQSKAKKKKKGPLPGGGMKANMKDNLADYLDYDGEFAQEFEDFM
ncbi:eukaryotic translation initiation factor 3 subunit J [Protopterus annectens]|uniref:eukaryotic translation initiation factor 3 subunit J n=1 Tax=Protopterus annectens TaxID=7888 RepID=UPI001CFA2F7F|nr:eukaryotic translation initiation factor 3 subunit J [Protopterus annectens]